MKLFIKVFILLVSFSSFYFAQEETKITTVDSVDINKYKGTWYEIAKIPNSFQDHCIKNTTAKYTVNEDGDIIVLNSCIDEDGELDDAEGLAKVVDKESNSKLEVSFVSIFGWHLFWGDYWIIGLDNDYQYAVIGTPSRKYGWILSRTKKMTDENLNNCLSILERNGYNIDKFEFTTQD